MNLDYEDDYQCPWCGMYIDLDKTEIDIILRKFDINEALVKCNEKKEELEKQRDILLKVVIEIKRDYEKRKITYGWHDLQYNMIQKALREIKSAQ